MSMESDIENLTQAVTLLIDAQRKEITKRKDLQALTLGLLDAVQGQHEANDLLRAKAERAESDLSMVKELLLDAARVSGHNTRDIAAVNRDIEAVNQRLERLTAATEANTQAIGALTEAIAKRNGNGATRGIQRHERRTQQWRQRHRQALYRHDGGRT